MPTGIKLLKECEERMECASEALRASVDKGAERGANGEGIGIGESPRAAASGA